jgi:hypothetical protein
MRNTKVLIGFAFLLLATSMLHAGSEEFTWSGSVAQGKTLEIKGVNGHIEAVEGSGEVEIVAVKTGKKNDPSEVRIEIVPHSDGLTVCAVYPSTGSSPNECAPGDGGRNSVKKNDVKVDFTVRVPSGVHFVGKTVNGGVSATNLGANAEGITVNGDVELSCAGTAKAKTVNGSITAVMYDWDNESDLSFTTVNGSVTVELPADVSADVAASCVNGSMSTDFPLTVKGKWGPKKLQGQLGGGGPELSVKTVNGNIELVQGLR